MPEGLARSECRDPRNFTLAEWQQAKRAGKDARAVKAAFQDAWAISDSKAAFIHALEERGYRVARGDRRGFVAVDCRGEVYAISKWADLKTRQVRDRLGDENDLPALAEVKRRIAGDMLSRLGAFQEQIAAEEQACWTQLETRRRALVRHQRAERQALRERMEHRGLTEAGIRQGRFRKGLSGLWGRLCGEHLRIREQNEREAEAAAIRDRAEKDALVFRQLEQRRRLNIFRLETRQRHEGLERELQQDVEAFRDMRSRSRDLATHRRPGGRRSHEPEP